MRPFKVVVSSICLSIALQGCILVSDAKYKADEAMWLAKAEASKAWANNSVKPLATFTTREGETFVVNNPNVAQPMVVVGEPSAIVQGADVILNSTVAKIVGGGWAAGYMLGKVQGNYSTGQGGTIDVTQDSNNSVDVTTRHTEGDNSGVAEEQHTNSDTVDTDNRVDDNSFVDNSSTDNRNNYNNATSEPTVVNPVVVTQPTPVIIGSTIVGGTDVELPKQ